MTLNASGPISLGGATTGQSINLELGVSATALASIDSTSFRNLAGVASGAISLSNFYGKSSTTYYFMRVTTTLPYALSDYMGHGVDSSDNYYWIGIVSNPCYILKATKTGSSVSGWQWSTSSGSSPNFYMATVTPSGRVVMNTQGGSTTSNPASTIMGVAFLSAAGSPSFYGGTSNTGYYWFDSGGSQVKSDIYTDSSFKPGGFNSSGDTYHQAAGYSFYIYGYNCCGDPLYDVQSSCAILMKVNVNNTIAYVYQIGVVSSSQTYAYMNTPLVRTDGLIVIGAQNTGGNNGFTLRLINDSAQTTTWNYKYVVTAPWGTLNYNSPALTLIDSSNNMYVASSTSRTTYGQGILVMQCNSSGGVTWAVGVRRGSNTTTFNISGFARDSSNNLYITGEYTGQIGYVCKLNSSGILQWSYTFGTNILARSVSVMSDGSIAVFLAVSGSFTANMVMTLPAAGGKTGTFTVGGQSVTVSVGTLTQDTGLTVTPSNSTNTAGFYAGSLSTRTSIYAPATTASLTTAISTTTI
jgi:hypothetical protein